MAKKTKKAVGRHSSGAKAATGKSLSGKVLATRSASKSKTAVKPRGAAALPGVLAKLAAAKPRIRLEMPVDERHVAAVRTFELGLQQEQKHNYRKAREIFEKLITTAPTDVADRSRVHLRACIERLGVTGPTPKTAGDYHVLGVAEINVGNLESAVQHLHKAQKLEPQREEIRYALAAAYSLKGDRDAALEHLKASILLRPQNRFQARHDPDFQAISGDDRFRALVSHNGHVSPGASN